MLLQHEFNTTSIYISRMSNKQYTLLVEVACNVLPNQVKIIDTWKNFLKDNLSGKRIKATEYKAVIVLHHMLSNYFKYYCNTSSPFFIKLYASKDFNSIREMVRQRVRVLDREEKLYIVKEKDVEENIDGVVKLNNNNTYVFHKGSKNDYLSQPISLILAKSYSYMNRNNEYLVLINNS